MTATVVGCGNRWGRKKRGYDSRSKGLLGSGGYRNMGQEGKGVGRACFESGTVVGYGNRWSRKERGYDSIK